MSRGHESGIIFDIERFAIHDGPGIRTVVFLKGCTLRCAWCQNPEGMSPLPELLYREDLCILCGRCAACPRGAHTVTDGRHVFARERCEACGACAAGCPTEALAVAGRRATVEEVMEVALRDRAFYQRSGGGITLSGGEPLMQASFAQALLRAAKAEGLHTAVETAGLVAWEAFEAVQEYVDLFLYDLKDTDPVRHKANTGGDLETVIGNLRRIDASHKGLWLRALSVPGVNDTPEHEAAVEALRQSLPHVERIETVPYHRLAVAKWKALGRGPEARDFGE